MRKIIFVLIAIAISTAPKAQITGVTLQASGLTCSMCSNAINKALKTLSFIDNVEADIKNYTFELSFKANTDVDFDKIKRKVEDAGFFVSGFVATIYFNNVQLKENQPVRMGNSTLFFVNGKTQSLKGAKQVKLLDKGFVTSKEYKSNALLKSLSNAGIYNVTL